MLISDLILIRVEWVVVKHTRTSTDIIQGQFGNSRVQLQEQRQRLSNTTSSTKNGYLGVLYSIINVS